MADKFVRDFTPFSIRKMQVTTVGCDYITVRKNWKIWYMKTTNVYKDSSCGETSFTASNTAKGRAIVEDAWWMQK